MLAEIAPRVEEDPYTLPHQFYSHHVESCRHKAGERIAEEIRSTMQTKGRRRRVAGDLVGLIGESSAGSTPHTGHAGWSHLESQQCDARLVNKIPACHHGGYGGMGPEEDDESAEQQEEKDTRKPGNPAANAFRRRSVRMYRHPGSIACTTTTTTSPSSGDIDSSRQGRKNETKWQTSCGTCRILTDDSARHDILSRRCEQPARASSFADIHNWSSCDHFGLSFSLPKRQQ